MNIINTLCKELEKGNKYLLADGNIVSEAKLTPKFRKEYLSKIKSDESLANTTLTDYIKKRLEEIPTLDTITDYVNGIAKKMIDTVDVDALPEASEN